MVDGDRCRGTGWRISGDSNSDNNILGLWPCKGNGAEGNKKSDTYLGVDKHDE